MLYLEFTAIVKAQEKQCTNILKKAVLTLIREEYVGV